MIPSPGTPAALGLQPAARGRRPDPGAADRGPGRRSVLTGTDILAATPVAQMGSGAGRLEAPVRHAAQSPGHPVPALSGVPAGSCALPAAGLSGRSSPRCACAARAAPPPSPLLRGGSIKGEDPGPRHFSVGPTRLRGSVSTSYLSFKGHFESHHLPCAHLVLDVRTLTPTLPSLGCWAPALWSGRAPGSCV